MLAVLLSGLSTALAVAASLFVSRFGTTASVVAVGLSFALGATVTYATSYQPLIRLKCRRQSILIDIVLNQLLAVYRNEIADCDLRANVMVPHSDTPWMSLSKASELSMKYATNGYTEWEQTLTYRTGEGAAGTAYRNEGPTVYDARTSRNVEMDMTIEQLVATEHVSSVISVPLYPRGNPGRKPIGVLSLDSTEHVTNTKFNKQVARSLLMKYARAIESLLQ